MPQWKGIVGKGFKAEDFAEYVKTVEFGVWRPQFIVLHNTAIPTFAQWHKVSGEQRMQGFQSYYRDQMHWSAGPHLFVADDLIWVFTPLSIPGVHSPSWNAISWGVEVVGNYDTEPLKPAVRDNIVAALATLHALVGIDPGTLKLHKQDPNTTHKGCPGKKIVKSSIVDAVLERLSADHPGEHLRKRVASGEGPI